MSYFNNICLLKAPLTSIMPDVGAVPDLIELCYLAAMIEPYVSSVFIPTDFHSKNSYDIYASSLKKKPVDLVCISSMTGGFSNALRLAKIAKEHDKYVVMGGYHPSALPVDVLKSPYIDAVIVGEGELTLKDLVQNGPSKDVLGMVYKENGKLVHTGVRPTIKDLDSLPHPLRHIRPRRFGENGTDYSIDTVYTSRGCPWKCCFCANDTVNKQWRARSPENVLEELIQLHDPNHKKLIKFWDANFMTDINRIEKICDLMLEHNLTNFKIWTETRLTDIIRGEKIMNKLYRVGLRAVTLGIESPNENTLKLMNKDNSIKECYQAIEILKKNQITPHGYFILGHYTETKEDTEKYSEYAESLGLNESVFMVMTPYPGTGIFKEYKRENKIKDYNWDNYNNFIPVVETVGMDVEMLRKMYLKTIGKFYTKFIMEVDWWEGKPLGMALSLHIILLSCNKICRRGGINCNTKDIQVQNFAMLQEGCRSYANNFTMGNKPSFYLKFFKKIVLRFTISKGLNIQYCVSLKNNSTNIIVEQTNSTGLIPGFTFHFDKIFKLLERIDCYTSSLISMDEILKLNPNKQVKYILRRLFDRDAIVPVSLIAVYIIPVIVKGALSLAVCSIASLFRKNRA